MNNSQAIVNYALNRFCPMLILAFLMLSNFSFNNWQLYAAIGLMIFMDKYQFKVGYSVGYCEASNIDPMSENPLPRKKN